MSDIDVYQFLVGSFINFGKRIPLLRDEDVIEMAMEHGSTREQAQTIAKILWRMCLYARDTSHIQPVWINDVARYNGSYSSAPLITSGPFHFTAKVKK